MKEDSEDVFLTDPELILQAYIRFYASREGECAWLMLSVSHLFSKTEEELEGWFFDEEDITLSDDHREVIIGERLTYDDEPEPTYGETRVPTAVFTAAVEERMAYFQDREILQIQIPFNC